MKLGGKHANKFGYGKYVGADVQVTGKKYNNDLIEVTLKVRDVPFPVSVAVHAEDVNYEQV